MLNRVGSCGSSPPCDAKGPAATPEGQDPTDLDKMELRELVLHLVTVACCYEQREPQARDEAAMSMLRDVTKRISRHTKALDRESTLAGASYHYENLHGIYTRFRDDPSISQADLRKMVSDYFACAGITLEPRQLDRAAPSREDLRIDGNASLLARTVLGEYVYGIKARRFHDWKEGDHEFDPPPAFGRYVDGPALVEYIIRALDPFPGDRRWRPDDAVLLQALETLKKAVAERNVASLKHDWATRASTASGQAKPVPEKP